MGTGPAGTERSAQRQALWAGILALTLLFFSSNSIPYGPIRGGWAIFQPILCYVVGVRRLHTGVDGQSHSDIYGASGDRDGNVNGKGKCSGTCACNANGAVESTKLPSL